MTSASRVSALLIVALAFATFACISSPLGSTTHHHHASALGDHLAHLESLTLAVLPAIFLFIFFAVAVLTWFILFDRPELQPARVRSLHSPPRRTKLARLFAQLRSPPISPR